jgi:DNA-binding NtrC family response regulator
MNELDREVKEFTKQRISEILRKCNGNVSAAAREIKTSQSTLWRKIKALGLFPYVLELRAKHHLALAEKERGEGER